MGVTVFHGVMTGSSGLIDQSLLLKNNRTQLSNFASLAFFSTSAWPAYFGWNCFR